MNRFFQALSNLFRIEDLRKRVLFTLAMLAVYRIGAHIPTPGIDAAVLEEYFKQAQNSALGIFDLFSGGNLRRLTIFALGIMPYITSSIILQLMTVVFPYLERLQKEGELGRRKITQYTRYLTVALSIIQSFSIATTLQHATGPNNQSFVYNPGVGFTLMTILTLTTGSAFIMWLGEQISERGIGNGMSLIIFVGIVVGLPRAIANLFELVKSGTWGGMGLSLLILAILVTFMIAVVAFIVLVEGGQRRIPVQYAKRVVGRRVMGGQSSYLPLRVNSGGVIPPIFASSLLAFPPTIALVLNHRYQFVDAFVKQIGFGEPAYNVLYVAMILAFAFFYIGIVFNPTELADNMRKNGGFIPGIRPGRNTSEYVSKILKRLTFVGAVYLAMICLLPEWMLTGIHFNHLGWGIGAWFDRHFPAWFLGGLGVNFYFGGTSLLIVVGVAMDTVQQLEAQLVMRNYEGFARKGRIRGRR
ncbi:MAG TPA: preprotein translocase subunit SecY [Candidatus Acidoferrum sp.]|nr:preprotein translocase subunit SecY [Candidatus Acidoferrum sp.]